MKWVLVLAVWANVGLCTDPVWFDEEQIHNRAHDLEELMGWPFFSYHENDTPEFKRAFETAKKALGNIHDQLHEKLDGKVGYKEVIEAVLDAEAPLNALVRATRRQDLKTGKRNPHTDRVLTIVLTYHELKFWMTPAAQ